MLTENTIGEDAMRILLLDIDTLRPDHMGCYGYPRNTTPNLDQIAQEGVRFTRCYTSDAPCLPSRAALQTGMFGIRNGAVGHGGTAADLRLTGEARSFRDPVLESGFHSLFRKAGLNTVSISTFAERHSSFWFNAGFNECYNQGKGGAESGEEVVPIALDWLKRNEKRDNWFMHLHLWDPHTPYRTPADYVNPFENDELPTWITPEVFKHHQGLVAPHGVNEISMYNDLEHPAFPKHPGKIGSYGELRRVWDGYDCGIHYADMLLGQVFDLLKQQGIYEDTAILLISDHGENLGELGIYAEHGTADDITCHVPLLIKWPGMQQGAVDETFHYSLDLVPTIADLLGIKHQQHWDGQSFSNTVKTGQTQGRDHLVLSQMAHVCQRSARFSDYLYMRTLHDGFRLFDREMLFDLKNDPHQQHDIKDDHPELCAKGAKIILDWQEDAMLKGPQVIDPLWTVMNEGGPLHTRGELDGYLEHLKRTGREEGARLLAAKHKK